MLLVIHASFCIPSLCQPVVEPVRMAGHSMVQPVQMVSVELTVKVSVFYKDVSWIFSLAMITIIYKDDDE